MLKELLKQKGYREVDNEFIKGDWTIRIGDREVEVFDNPDTGKGYYFKGFINKIDLLTLLNEIDNFLLD